MIYVYDILLNWNKEIIYDFFEWEKEDKLEHIKKIPLFRVKKGIINDFLNFNIKIDESFINKITTPAEIYNYKKILKVPYTFLISDSEIVIAVKCDKSGNVLFKSKLILDEEEEILCISSRINEVEIGYKRGKYINNNTFLTRKEIKIKRYLFDELKQSYESKNYEKIKYLYYEYFDKATNDFESAYNELKGTLNIGVDYKHNKLYDLLQLIGNKN